MLSTCCNICIKLQRNNNKNRERITQIKSLIYKYKWKGINFPPEKRWLEKLEKSNQTISLNVLYVKKENYILLMFQNITQNLKHKLFFYCFQMEKDAKLLYVDTKLSSKDDDGIIMQ